MWVQRHRTAISVQSWRQIHHQDKLSTIFTKIGVQKSVPCSTVARIRSFRVNNKQLGILEEYTHVMLVHGLSFSLISPGAGFMNRRSSGTPT